jgi:hypothetical protein
MRRIAVLLVGDTRPAEFLDARRSLIELAELTESPEPAAAAAILQSGLVDPEVIVLAQAYPGQISHSQVDQLRRLAPLARMVALLGTWCEGEGRSGRPWPGVVRVYWHQWAARSAQELARIACGQLPAWSLPPTATEEERLLVSAEAPLPTGEGLIAIHARQTAMADWLASACRQAGYSTLRLCGPNWPQFAGVRAGLFDATDLGPSETSELDRLVAQIRPAPVLVLLDFPRPGVLPPGAAAILSKPVLLEDLLWHLDAVG